MERIEYLKTTIRDMDYLLIFAKELWLKGLYGGACGQKNYLEGIVFELRTALTAAEIERADLEEDKNVGA